MQKEFILYTLYSSISTIISLTSAYLFWRRRRLTGILYMTLTMVLASVWAFTEMISVASMDIGQKVFWDNISYVGVFFIPVSWFLFSLQYTRQNIKLTYKTYLLFCIIPLISLVLIFTNNYHHLFIANKTLYRLGSSDYSIINPTYGTWFWVHAFYSYALLLIGTFLLLKSFINLGKIYRNQAIILTLAVFFPLGGSVFYSFGISPSGPIDTTAFSFSIAGIIIFWGLFKYKLFDIVPIARGAVIESMDDIIIILDNSNRIVDLNEVAKEELNIQDVDIIGQPVLSILKDDLGFFDKYIDSNNINEEVVVRHGTRECFYDLKISPLYNNKNNLVGRFVILHDITRLREIMDELKKSRTIAENASKAKSQFLATMSHEIRTPLNGIIGMAELLNSASLTDEEKGFLKAIKYSANSLLDIINDVLDFSKIEAGKMELDNINFNISELLLATLNMFGYSHNKPEVKLVSFIDNAVPEFVYGDPVRVKQIIMNLVGNSLKFTEKGQISAELKLLTSDANSVLLRLCISDTGIGIPAEKIETLFDSFTQLDNSTTRKYGGTGLGLAIVRNLAELMNGNIKVESALGLGSKFIVDMPFGIRDSVAANRSEITEIPSEAISGLKILLAEDNKVNQLFMVKLLQKQGYLVETAENGKIVLEKLKRETYDLILMDIQMPEMDGFETTINIRRDEQNSGNYMPIIALTANATTDDKRKCLEMGMDDYISKPINPERLYSSINRIIYMSRQGNLKKM